MVIQNPLNAGKSRYFLLLPIPIMLQLLVFTASRVSMLALVLAILAGISLLGTLKLSSKILMIMSGLLVFGIAWIYMLQSDVMGMRFLLILQERDLSGRDIIWQNIIPLIKENPVFGVGTTGYTDFSQNTFGLYNSPHNVFLEILCYTGIVGLGIYLIFLYRIAVKSFKVFKHQRILLPLILMIPIMGMIGTSQILGVKTGWILFAYIAASSAGLESGSRSDQLSGPGRT